MGRKLKTDVVGEDRRIAAEDLRDHGWRALFEKDLPEPRSFVVEIGFGRGEFLLDQAGRELDTAFLGVELSYKRLLKMARRVARLGVPNVRLLEARGETVVGELLAPASVDVFWVNFSDPWPKRRHAPRRLVQIPFLEDVARCLAEGGTLHVATDDPTYADWIDDLLPRVAGLENALAPEPHARSVPGRMATAYEREWRERGRTPYFWTYRRPTASVDAT